MCIQHFAPGHFHHSLADVQNTGWRNVLEGDLAQKAVQVHPVIGHRIAACGKRVVGTAGIVARTLGSPSSQEHAARIHHLCSKLHVIGGLDNQMFGRITVGHLHHFLLIVEQDNLAVLQ